MEMEIAAKVKTELAFSGLFPVVSILNKNFRDVITPDEMKPLNDFVDYKIEELTREAKSDDLLQLMPLLKELQAAALKLKDLLDLYEYNLIEIQVSSSSSETIPKEKVLPEDLSDGLNKLLKSVERVENIRKPIASKTGTGSFIDFLVGESHVARPAIELAISDISRAIEMLGSNFRDDIINAEILEQLKDVVRYHIQALIRIVYFDDSAQSMQLRDMMETASEQLDQFVAYEYNTREYGSMEEQGSSYYSFPSKKEELGPILSKSPLRIGLEILMRHVEQMENKHSSSTKERQPEKNTSTLSSGVAKWLKFVEQVEKEHPVISSKKDTTDPISTTFFPTRGFLSTRSLENVKCQEDVEEIMRNHKKNLKTLNFGWSKTGSSINTCEEVLSRLEPDQNLRSLSITWYSYAKFPNWMLRENWLPSLQSLIFRGCRSLKIVPILPPRLHLLYVRDCDELMQLPPLSDSLRTLSLVDCPKLMVPLMFNKSLGLNEVTIDNCSRNESRLFIDMSFLTNLKVLVLARFPNLQTLACSNPALTNLTIEDCPKLTSMGNIQGCTSLQLLVIFKCPMLSREESSLVEGVVEEDIAHRLPQVESFWTDEPLLVLNLLQQKAFSSLQQLSLIAFQRPFPPMLHEYFHQFSSLTRLTLEGFTTLPILEELPSLGYLTIRNSPNVESLPELPVSLQYLRIWGCPKLKEKYAFDFASKLN